MTELIFQCPNCSALSRCGTITTSERHLTRPVMCEWCHRESLVPLVQMLLHDTVTGRVVRVADENSEG